MGSARCIQTGLASGDARAPLQPLSSSDSMMGDAQVYTFECATGSPED